MRTPNLSTRLVSLLAILVPHLTACGEVRLPPPAAPEKVLPAATEVPDEAPAAGTGRVLLEANGEKARVVEVGGARFESQGYRVDMLTERPVCSATPCVVDLPRGSHTLVFFSPTDPNRGSPVEVDAVSHPKVVRHAMGERVPHKGLKAARTASFVVGGVGVGVGSVLLLLSSASSLSDYTGAEVSTGPTAGPGAAVLGLGLGAIAAGIVLHVLGRTEVREGTTTEWRLGDGESPRAKPGVGTTTSVRLSPSAGGLGLTF